MSLERNYYTDRFLDEDFEKAIVSKNKLILEKYTEKSLNSLYYSDVQKINKALIEEKTSNNYYKKIYRKCKRLMLEYLDRCIREDLSNLSYKEKIEIKSLYVDRIVTQIEHLGFRTRGYWVFFSLIGLFLDVLLMLFGIAKYYYYTPIFFILITYKQIKGIKKAKSLGKLLKW